MPTSGRGARGRRGPTSSPISARGRARRARRRRPQVSGYDARRGGGNRLVASDGGVFTFGNARFFGSTASTPLAHPVTGMATTVDEGGYWMVESDGKTVLAFGRPL